jgi:hypothetical protein
MILVDNGESAFFKRKVKGPTRIFFLSASSYKSGKSTTVVDLKK